MAVCLAPISVAGLSLAPNTAVVVTTDGVWIPDPDSAVALLHIPPSSFPGNVAAQGELTRPAIEWDRNSDSLLVSSGAQLFRVRISSFVPPAFSVEEITPASVMPLDVWDLDLHPGTGELYVLDQSNNEVLRYAPPFSAGMQANLAIAVPGTSRAMAIDSRNIPTSVVIGETSQVTRVTLDGQLSVVSALLSTRGLDADPQIAGNGSSFMVVPASNKVVRATGSTGLIVNMNLLGFCTPLALKPEDVEWNPAKNRAYVLGSDGVNQSMACQQQLGASGPNHVFSFPVAQAPPNVIPKLLTFTGGSGITGTQGDLTIVLEPFSFVSPLGAACLAGAPSAIELDSSTLPTFDATTLSFQLENAPTNAAVFAVVGLSRVALPLAGSCTLVAAPDFVKLVGFSTSQGDFEITVNSPPGIVPGFDTFLQFAMPSASGLSLSQGLQLHFAE